MYKIVFSFCWILLNVNIFDHMCRNVNVTLFRDRGTVSHDGSGKVELGW